MAHLVYFLILMKVSTAFRKPKYVTWHPQASKEKTFGRPSTA